ncbi:hypothetical protein GCM10009804_14960 [Kribbella hippodromi]|uniref:Uncharacterized protein n=1 Tax=Kribbella hippodromi TaxID=434347 RepID=A0ABN2CKD3_9ACTN
MPSIDPEPLGFALAYAAQPGPTMPAAALLAEGVSLVLGVSAGADEDVLVDGVLLELFLSLLLHAAVVRTRARAVAAKPARTIFWDMTISFLTWDASGFAHT